MKHSIVLCGQMWNRVVCLVQAASLLEDCTQMMYMMAAVPRPLEAQPLRIGAHSTYSLLMLGPCVWAAGLRLLEAQPLRSGAHTPATQ